MGARVIKIEHPKRGDAGRKLAIKDLWVDDNSLLFHTINRNKESFSADFKNPDDFAMLKMLIAKADVITHNFRPGVMEKAGLDYASVQHLNPLIIYASISGYGDKGPWKDLPGQDLLLQSVSGLAYTTGNATDAPVPFGLSIADILCGAQLVQGILAALIRRQKTGYGALIELSLLESILDFQFELLTTFYAGGKQPLRGALNSGHTLLAAPYGIYKTADDFIAIAMMPLQKLVTVIDCNELLQFSQEEAFGKRDAIKTILKKHLEARPAAYWLALLHAKDIWAMQVLDWKQMRDTDAYQSLSMEQTIDVDDNGIITTRCPITINGRQLTSFVPAPELGAQNEKILSELKDVHVLK